MDLEEIYDEANKTTNLTDYVYQAATYEIVLHWIEFLVCIIGTTFDIFIIYIIARYKNMKKPVNIYILNWLICDALFILADPIEYHIYSIREGFNITWDVMCILFTTVMIIRTLAMLFMLVIMFYWFFDKTKIVLLEKHCRRVVIAVWSFGLIDLIVTAPPCFMHHYYGYLGENFLLLIILVFIVTLLTIHSKRRCANPFSSTSSLPIALITSFALCWSVFITINLLHPFHSRDTHMLFKISNFISQLLIYLYPAVMFYLFYKMDPQFCMCVKILFRKNGSEEVDVCFEGGIDEGRNDEDNHPS